MASARFLSRSWLIVAVSAALAACAGYPLSNQRSPGPPPVESHAAPVPPGGIYTVEPGDTIYVVARRFGVPLRGLIEANGLVAPFQLTPGQQLRMPDNRGYIVVKGDTLSAIARRTGVEFATLARINGLRPPYTIRVGQRLSLPSDARVQTASAGGTDVIASPVAGPNVSITPAAPLNPAQQPSVSATPLDAPVPRPPASSLTAAPLAPPSAAAPPPAGKALVLTSPIAPAAPAVQPRSALSPQPTPLAAAPAPAPAPALAAPPPAQAVAAIEPPPAAALRPADAPDFMWPVQGAVLVPFGDIAKGQHNDGINIAVPKGTPVLAAADGEVAYAGNELSGFGNMVLVSHKGTDYVTVYAHNDKNLVRRGDHVRRGQKIAISGASGGVTQPQLLFEVRKGVKPVDPQTLLPESLSPNAAPADQPDPG